MKKLLTIFILLGGFLFIFQNFKELNTQVSAAEDLTCNGGADAYYYAFRNCPDTFERRPDERCIDTAQRLQCYQSGEGDSNQCMYYVTYSCPGKHTFGGGCEEIAGAPSSSCQFNENFCGIQQCDCFMKNGSSREVAGRDMTATCGQNTTPPVVENPAPIVPPTPVTPPAPPVQPPVPTVPPTQPVVPPVQPAPVVPPVVPPTEPILNPVPPVVTPVVPPIVPPTESEQPGEGNLPSPTPSPIEEIQPIPPVAPPTTPVNPVVPPATNPGNSNERTIDNTSDSTTEENRAENTVTILAEATNQFGRVLGANTLSPTGLNLKVVIIAVSLAFILPILYLGRRFLVPQQ